MPPAQLISAMALGLCPWLRCTSGRALRPAVQLLIPLARHGRPVLPEALRVQAAR